VENLPALEILKQITEILPFGKLSSGIAASFLIIPIRPDLPWELMLFFYIFIGGVFGAICFFANELILKGLNIGYSKTSSKMGLLDRLGFLEAFFLVIFICLLRGGTIC